jgi:hypothetical protein
LWRYYSPEERTSDLHPLIKGIAIDAWVDGLWGDRSGTILVKPVFEYYRWEKNDLQRCWDFVVNEKYISCIRQYQPVITHINSETIAAQGTMACGSTDKGTACTSPSGNWGLFDIIYTQSAFANENTLAGTVIHERTHASSNLYPWPTRECPAYTAEHNALGCTGEPPEDVDPWYDYYCNGGPKPED